MNGQPEFAICSGRMDRVLTLSSFEREESENSYLDYSLSRPPEERIEEADRLRREFVTLSKPHLLADARMTCRKCLISPRQRSHLSTAG
jgi:hypothetical protein